MSMIPIVIRNVALIGLAAFMFATSGLGITDANNPLLAVLALCFLMYFVLELFAIVYKLIRYRKIEDSDDVLRVATYKQNHQLDFKVVAILRRFAMAGVIALIVSVFVKHLSFDTVANGQNPGGLAGIAIAYFRWSLIMLPALLIMTFVKSWFIMHDKWEGSYSTFSIFGKYMSLDFGIPENMVEKILYVIAVALAVGSVLAV